MSEARNQRKFWCKSCRIFVEYNYNSIQSHNNSQKHRRILEQDKKYESTKKTFQKQYGLEKEEEIKLPKTTAHSNQPKSFGTSHIFKEIQDEYISKQKNDNPSYLKRLDPFSENTNINDKYNQELREIEYKKKLEQSTQVGAWEEVSTTQTFLKKIDNTMEIQKESDTKDFEDHSKALESDEENDRKASRSRNSSISDLSNYSGKGRLTDRSNLEPEEIIEINNKLKRFNNVYNTINTSCSTKLSNLNQSKTEVNSNGNIITFKKKITQNKARSKVNSNLD